jgi:hypothetical protein
MDLFQYDTGEREGYGCRSDILAVHHHLQPGIFKSDPPAGWFHMLNPDLLGRESGGQEKEEQQK